LRNLGIRRAARSAALAAVLTLPGLCCAEGLAAPAGPGAVIPRPASAVRRPGVFALDGGTRILAPRGDRDAGAAAAALAQLVLRSRGLTLAPVTHSGAGRGAAIEFRLRPDLAAEAYEVDVAPRRVTLAASTASGYFYAAMTLWQLLPPGRGGGVIPAQRIRDAPAYPWRGLMLDSARHFQSPAFIRKTIDWMSWHKLNVLHWHLTDDQGWRLQVLRYPRLTEIGAWRVPATVDGGTGAAYGGYYSQDEVRAIVVYAAAHHVQIVPEIEMPGHAEAAIAAYPQLGVMDAAAPGPAPPAVSPSWGVHTHLFNLEPETFAFLKGVLDEVMDLFPGSFVHLGGDEAVKDEWMSSPSVRARAQALGIAAPAALQAYFTQEMGRHLAAHGRRLVGWDEILQPGLPPDAAVMSWHGTSGAHAAALGGHDAILCPWPTLYFDNRQSALPDEPPGRLQVVSLQDVYNFDPTDQGLPAQARQHVLGLQGAVWTEHIRTEARVEWMALPRIAAVAETAWSGADGRSWTDFLRRLAPMMQRYRDLGVDAADSVFAVAMAVERHADDARVVLSNQAGWEAPGMDGLIRYTLDGTEPTPRSPSYHAPLVVHGAMQLRAASFVGAVRTAHTTGQWIDAGADRRLDSHDLESCTLGIGLLIEPGSGAASRGAPLALDIMNPCWIARGIDLANGAELTAAVVPLPFNFEIGADLNKVRVGDARSADGEFEVHVDGCDGPAVRSLPLAPAAGKSSVTQLPPSRLDPLPGRHDLCLRLARPRVDPMWALDWIRIRE
jgi:hexosaminidase